MTALWVAIGGAVGSVMRYGLVQMLPFRDFPFGVLLVNVAGCFAIGVLRALPPGQLPLPASLRDALIIGVLGGFTTFSAFAFDTVDLFMHDNRSYAILNIVAQVFMCLSACAVGYAVAKTA
ncbi:MAG: fluoride efflux transporter CrcB [Candidatus Porifericomitaceae bacterium WSBS_2022_MAG_OTU9]